MRALCTDFGSESSIVDAPDLVPAFVASVGIVPHPSQVHMLEPEPFLFKRAFWFPGWQHSCDTALKDVVYKLAFFPSFLKKLKACIAWLCCDSYRQATAREACNYSQDGRVFDKVPPSFAHWRWGTLRNVTSYLMARGELLALVWSRKVLPSVKAPADLQEVDAALSDPLFWSQLRIVGDIADAFHGLRTWGAGCACHSAERMEGKVVRCSVQGRRLPDAKGRVAEFTNMMLAQAMKAPVGSYCDGASLPPDLELSRAYAFRSAAPIAQRKWELLDSLPYSLGRARDRAIMRECLAKFRATPPQRWHRVAEEFFGDGSELLEHVESFLATGALHQHLDISLKSVERAPMTAGAVEAPHAVMHREKTRQRASSRAWFAASLRLPDNLAAYGKFRRQRAECRCVFCCVGADWPAGPSAP